MLGREGRLREGKDDYVINSILQSKEYRTQHPYLHLLIIAPQFSFGSFLLPNTCSLSEIVNPHVLHFLANGWACGPL